MNITALRETKHITNLNLNLKKLNSIMSFLPMVGNPIHFKRNNQRRAIKKLFLLRILRIQFINYGFSVLYKA